MAQEMITRGDAQPLIPEEVNALIQSLPQASAVLSKARQVKMSRKQKRVPVLSLLPTAYFRTGGGTALRRTSKMTWANKYLDAEELSVIVPIEKQVLDDAEFDIWGEVKPRVIEALGAKIDAAILFGDDKPNTWPDSIEDAAQAAGNVFTRGSINGQDVAGDINDLMGLVETDGYDVSGFCARKTLKASLRGLRTNEGALLFQPTLQAGTPDSLYGEMIHYAQNGGWNNAEADLIAGDWTQLIVGLREDVTWEIWKEASIYDPQTQELVYALAQMGMVAICVTMRIAFQVPNPVNRMNDDNDSRFPFSVLRPVGY